MVDQSQVDAVSGVNGLEGESIAPGEVDAGDVLRVPAYSDNANALQEDESIWYNDGTGPDPEGFYGFKGGATFGPFGDVHNPATQDLDLDGHAIANAGEISASDLSITNTGGRVFRDAYQTVSNDTNTRIQFDTVDYDDRGEWDPTNHEFVLSNSGKYSVCTKTLWNKTIADGSRLRMEIRVNGATVSQKYTNTGASDHSSTSVSDTLDLSAGDAVAVQVKQVSGSAVDIYGGKRWTTLTVTQVA